MHPASSRIYYSAQDKRGIWHSFDGNGRSFAGDWRILLGKTPIFRMARDKLRARRLQTNAIEISHQVRNPIYTACFFTILGWYFIWRAVHGLLFMPIILAVILIGTFIEENYLSKTFGDEHREYKQRVPMLFPLPLLVVLIMVLAIVMISIIFG
jgi:hypothetical protein